MPLCYPPEPEFGEGRHGERAVWEALAATLPDDAALLHSVWLTQDRREVDLLVAWPGVGLAVIEVKGGTVERDGTGWWSSRRGERRSIEAPLEQAQDTRYALRRVLREHGSQVATVRTQHLVALPHMAVPADYDPPECPRGQVVDCQDLSRVDEVVRAAVDAGDGYAPLDAAGVRDLVHLLRRQLPARPLLVQAEEHEQRVDQMTRDGVEVLEGFRHFPRLVVTGGAGTGKTSWALAQAQRLARDRKRVALLCYSRGLAGLLQRTTAQWERKPAYTGLFHDLPTLWGAAPSTGEESAYYEVERPRELGALAAARPPADLFDAVVVDEAQDFGELWWASLLACLRDPDGGGVFAFQDEAQRVFDRRSRPPVDIPPFVLTTNVRNTKRIAQVFGSLAPERAGYRGIDGPPVRFVQCATAEALSRGDDAVDALAAMWAPGQVALLTTMHRHPEHESLLRSHGSQAYWDDYFAATDVFYGHVLGFKGLERPAVVLAVDGFRQPDRAREMLSVGLSRARTQLVVCGGLAEIASVGGEGVRRRLADAEPWQP